MEELPKEIQSLMVQRHYEQYKNTNVDTKYPSNLGEAFTWYNTIEGHDFWNKIYNGDIEHFYTLYPKSIIKSEYEAMYKKMFRKNRIESRDVDIEKLKELGLDYILINK